MNWLVWKELHSDFYSLNNPHNFLVILNLYLALSSLIESRTHPCNVVKFAITRLSGSSFLFFFIFCHWLLYTKSSRVIVYENLLFINIFLLVYDWSRCVM